MSFFYLNSFMVQYHPISDPEGEFSPLGVSMILALRAVIINVYGGRLLFYHPHRIMECACLYDLVDLTMGEEFGFFSYPLFSWKLLLGMWTLLYPLLYSIDKRLGYFNSPTRL